MQWPLLPPRAVPREGDERAAWPYHSTPARTGEAEEIGKNEVDPFLLSGCQLTGGSGCMVVIAVGKESRWGRIRVRSPP